MTRWIAPALCAGLAACAGDDGAVVARAAGVSQQYELRPSSPGEWDACRRPGEPGACREVLITAARDGARVRREEPEAVCCWSCASGRNACGSEQWPGRPLALGAQPLPTQGRCEAAVAADFEGAGATALRLYLDWLVYAYGAPYVTDPAEVSLALPDSHPRPSEAGITAGEVSCGNPGHGAAFRITLFRKALEGRPLQAAYGALAHEFRHVVQIRRDGLACKPTPATKRALEQEAEDWARTLMPPCGA